MPVIRTEKTENFTVISNRYLQDKTLSLKAVGLLTKMLSFPEDWEYSILGLEAICKESRISIASGLKELEEHGYLTRKRLRNEQGKLGEVVYCIYESPHPPEAQNPTLDNLKLGHPTLDHPKQGNPDQGNVLQ